MTAPEEAIGLAAEVLHGTIWQQSPGWERRFAHAALAAALLVLLEELAQRIGGSDIKNWDFGPNVKSNAVAIVRGFAAEATQ